MYSKKELDKIEEAIKFASREIEKNCRNQKPLLLHSVIVATKLMELKASYEAVVAGALHDLVEDTNCTLKDIEKRFGAEVAWKHRFLVRTFKPHLKNNQFFKNYRKMVEEIEA